MSKKKREQEKRILAEMREAIEGEKTPEAKAGEPAPNVDPNVDPKKEEVLHCRRCKSVMKNGVCPVCGYKTYMPMSEEKRKKIRGIVAVVCLAVFVVLFAIVKR